MAKRKSQSGKSRGKNAAPPLDQIFLEGPFADIVQQLMSPRIQDEAVDKAQEIIFDAWEEPSRKKRVTMAKKSLAVSPLCADAYVLLAQDSAETPQQALAFYRQGVAAGEKSLGDSLQDDAGDFWGLIETRPYMRALQGLATSLWQTGARDDAVAKYQEMLRLNPNDNQGVRYSLMDCLLTLGRGGEAEKLYTRYKQDCSAAWSWSRALLQFRRDGDGAASRKALARAVDGNSFVRAYLLGDKKLPSRLPDYMSWGDEDEAMHYAHGAGEIWRSTEGALAWLAAAGGGARKARPSRK